MPVYRLYSMFNMLPQCVSACMGVCLGGRVRPMGVDFTYKGTASSVKTTGTSTGKTTVAQ